MKKLVYSFAIIAAALTLSYLFVNQSLFANPFNQPRDNPYYTNQTVSTFEQLYMHLYDDDQDALDTAFAQALKDEQINELTLDEALVELDLIKASLVLDFEILFDDAYRTYGMMGGRGYGCHNNINVESYEFYYMHQTYSTRQYMDEQFLTSLSSYDLSTLELADIVLLVDQIKTEILLDLTNN